MDLETENRIAKALLEEARKMRMEADKEGVEAYLRKPGVRARPNSRFLTATVLGVQQANRAVEVNEMWQAREKEIELDNKHSRLKERSKHHGESFNGSSSYRSEHEKRYLVASCSAHNADRSDCYSDEDRHGLHDEEIEQFLRSRVKRGRGEIGSRMDEPGPYLASTHNDISDAETEDSKRRRVVGPEKPPFLKSSSSAKSTKENGSSKDKKKKEKKREKDKDKHKKKRKEERSKHRHRSRKSE